MAIISGSLDDAGSIVLTLATINPNENRAIWSISGTYGTAVLQIEGMQEGGSWVALAALSLADGVVDANTLTPSDNTSVGWQVDVEGFVATRLTCVSIGSGQVDVVGISGFFPGSPAVQVVSLAGSSVGSVNITGGISNTTTHAGVLNNPLAVEVVGGAVNTAIQAGVLANPFAVELIGGNGNDGTRGGINGNPLATVDAGPAWTPSQLATSVVNTTAAAVTNCKVAGQTTIIDDITLSSNTTMIVAIKDSSNTVLINLQVIANTGTQQYTFRDGLRSSVTNTELSVVENTNGALEVWTSAHTI